MKRIELIEFLPEDVKTFLKTAKPAEVNEAANAQIEAPEDDEQLCLQLAILMSCYSNWDQAQENILKVFLSVTSLETTYVNVEDFNDFKLKSIIGSDFDTDSITSFE